MTRNILHTELKIPWIKKKQFSIQMRMNVLTVHTFYFKKGSKSTQNTAPDCQVFCTRWQPKPHNF